ncbi:MAG TPA: type IV secretion system protein [Rickettsia endosymbiont of Pyrocoelia pectoralis]|nr:type IV secretion system protein [Rickettsia endosymbiont of Pyrocoelia pectoralis]
MKPFARSILTILIVTFTLNFGFTNKAHADNVLESITNTLTNLTCETQGVGDLLGSEFSHTCIVAPFFTFAVMNLVSPVLYMNTMLKLKINDDELFKTQFPEGQCARQNRIDPDNLELNFGLCSNLKLAGVRGKAVAASALAIAKAVFTGEDPWDDIKEAWKNNKSDYYNMYVGKPGDSDTMWDLGVPIFWKIIQDNDRLCVATYGFTGDVPVGCKYIKEPFPKSMYNSFMDISDTDFIEDPNATPTDPLALVSCSAAGDGCYQKAYNASKTAVVMTSPLIECMRQMIARLLISKDVCSFDDVEAVIDSASRETSSLFQFQVAMYKIVTAFLTLYVIFFGLKIILSGEVPPKNEYINFILKMIFVTYFSIGINITPGSSSPYDRLDGMIQWAFPFLLNGINGLASWVMNAAPSDLCKFNGSNISYDPSVAYIALWDALDCRVAHYLGLDMLSTLLVENTYRSHDFLNFDFFSFSAPPYIYLLIPAIISGNMMLVSLALSYPLLVISVAAFMVNATIMCMISIVILGILAPLFVPMLLFTYTKPYFDSWVKFLISFLLQPMVVVTFMITMFSVYDFGFYGKCKYSSKLINNSIEDIAQGHTSKRDVLIFYINNDWSQYDKDDAKDCQNSLGYMLNNPLATMFNFAKDSVDEMYKSKDDKPGEGSTDNFLGKFEFLSGVVLGPGMFFTSPKVLFEKIKNILLALVTACFTLYLMYNFSSQLAEFAADLTEGVALSNVAIKPQAIFKAAMAGLALAGAATKGVDKLAARGGGVGDLGGGTGGEAGDFKAGSGGGVSDNMTTSGGRPSSTIATPSSASASSGTGVGGGAAPSTSSTEQLDTSFSNRASIEAPVQPIQPSSPVQSSTPKTSQDSKAEDLTDNLGATKRTEEAGPQQPRVKNTTETEPELDVSATVDSQKVTREAGPQEPRVKHTTEIEPELDLSGDLKVDRTIRGLANDRVFNEKESHELKQGDAGYVKQEMKNAQIRDRKAAFEKETEELYRSGGGRARDAENPKSERNDGTIENRSKKIDSGSDDNT